MRLARARLARRETADGRFKAKDDVPLGKIYEVDLDSVVRGPLGAVISGLDGKRWVPMPLELLDVEVPQGFAKEVPRGD